MRLLFEEIKRGNFIETIRLSRKNGRFTIAHDISHAELLHEKAQQHGDRIFLSFYGQTFTYSQMDNNANRIANYLLSIGAGRGEALGIMMANSPRWLDVFFGTQRIGMCAVPINIALKGDQLTHILNHSDAHFLCIDDDILPYYEKIKDNLIHKPKIIVNIKNHVPDSKIPEEYFLLDKAYAQGISMSAPDIKPREGDICLLMYTSGTTGLPKGVPTYYGRTNIRLMSVLNRATLHADDVYYTCLPLFHANALILTVIAALNADAMVALGTKFSASRFWDEVRVTGATIFNTIGGIIPILMRQPEKPSDRQHKVKRVLSAACPADMWEAFEKRFGVKIIEGYGAVDTGGFIVLNFGQAPVGSMGKPIGAKYRVVDDSMKDVPPGKPGELIFYTGKGNKRAVEYYRDEKATSSKISDGWLHTGDLVYTDKKGYLYFVGRKTESIRRRGENISAYEVEQAILQYSDVLECAVYGVPSELGENDVMAAIVTVENKSIEPMELKKFLEDRIAKFAVPRYFRFLPELPKTETQRVIKGVLSKEGVTPDTIDLQRTQGAGAK
ncbi:MAG: AMP-binding protein [bacterium]